MSATEKSTSLPDLRVEDVIDLLAESPEHNEAIIVGGQALNIWAERSYQLRPEGVMSSEDLDLLAPLKVATQLNTAWGAEIRIPALDDFTPNSAVVYVEFAGGVRAIDFLHSIFGIDSEEVRRLAVPFSIPSAGSAERKQIKVMHPVHCLVSQIFNGYEKKLFRRFDKVTGELFVERVRISVIVARKSIEEYLSQSRIKAAKKLVEKIVDLSTKTPALLAYHEDGIDVLDAVPVDHDGWKEGFRENVFLPMTKRIAKKRSDFSARKRKKQAESAGNTK